MIPQSPKSKSPPYQHLMFLLTQLVLLFLLLFQLSSHSFDHLWILLSCPSGRPCWLFHFCPWSFFHPVYQSLFHHHHRHHSPRLENLLKLQSSCCSCPPWSESCRGNPASCDLLLHKCSSGTCHLHALDVGTCIALHVDILDRTSKSDIQVVLDSQLCYPSGFSLQDFLDLCLVHLDYPWQVQPQQEASDEVA